MGYIVTDNGVVMADTPYRPTDMIAWQQEIEAKGPIRYLVNLEPHIDHCCGNLISTAIAIAHEKTREAMLTIDLNHVAEIMAALDPDVDITIDKSKFNLPSITFSEHLTLHLGKHNIRLIHLPGHTAGQIALFVPEERVVFTGDNITYKLRSFLPDAEPFSWLESLDKIGELEVDHIVPGHGDICDKSYLKEQAKYIQDCLDAVRQAIERGWTKEEAMARVSWPSYLPVDAGTENMALQLTRLGISRLYEVLSHQ